MDTALANVLQQFSEHHPLSRKKHEAALASMPGGNTRTLLWTAPYPVYMQKGEGYKLYDVDGNQYWDFVGELTAGLFGHSNPRLKSALKDTIDNIGLNLGATTTLEQQYASLICTRFDLEHIRFTNSGTEANLHCLAAARRFTNRRKVVVFRGGYHGSVLSFAFGSAPNNVDQGDWIVLQYNDIDAVKEAFRKHHDIAAVIVECMQGSAGSITATREFLLALRELTEQSGTVLIFDEVMTSRLAPGGLQTIFGVKPDLTTLGKYLGGGTPFGAFGGRKSIMDVFDPRTVDTLAHSGTFQNNTLMLSAGYTALSEIYTPEVVAPFNERGEKLRQQLQEVLHGTKFTVTGRGSLMCIHASHAGIAVSDITCKDNIAKVEHADLKKLFWLEMINAGFWVQLRGSIALGLDLPPEALDAFVQAVKEFRKTHWNLIKVDINRLL